MPETTYYWQVVAVTPGGKSVGPVWSFTTRSCAPPTAAANPSPPNLATAVPQTIDLIWNVEPNLITFDEVANGTIVDNLMIGDVTFSYEDGFALIQDDNFASEYLDLPALVSPDTGGTLTLEFGIPVFNVGYGFAFGTNEPVDVGSQMQLWDSDNNLLGEFESSATDHGFGLVEGMVQGESETPIHRATLTFPHPNADVFAVDNVEYGGTEDFTGCVADSSHLLLSSSAAKSSKSNRVDDSFSSLWMKSIPEAALRFADARANRSNDSIEQGSVAGGAGCTASYDVVLGTTNPPEEIVCVGVTQPICDPGLLEGNTTYYWQVVTHAPGQATLGEVWSFTTPCDMLGSSPENCTHDARQTRSPESGISLGWRVVDLQFECSTAGLSFDDFEVHVEEGTAPPILGVSFR